MKITAFYLAERLQLKELRSAYAGSLIQENPSELFYKADNDRYFYAFDYGVAVFANMTDVEISQNLSFLQQFTQNPLDDKIRDDFEVLSSDKDLPEFGFDVMYTHLLDDAVLRVVMQNLAHSVALDYFAHQSQLLLSEITGFTRQLEYEGRIRISRKNMLRFIGRALNHKNRIVDDLFIFDSPELTWENEYLDRVHRGLARTFETQSRFREIEYTFKIIEDNLAVFRELYMHRENSQMEWIIIVLILIEVIDLVVNKLQHYF
jgi:required for meiotic nuclear division protein 1